MTKTKQNWEQQKPQNKTKRTHLYCRMKSQFTPTYLIFFFCLRSQLYSCNVLHCFRYLRHVVNTSARFASRLQLLSSTTITTTFPNFLLLLIHLHSSKPPPQPPLLIPLSTLSLSPWFFAIRLPLSLRYRLLFG